jgi:hypothetical protein
MLTVLVGALLLGGCESVVESNAQEPSVLEGLGPGIHPIVVVANQSADKATVALYLKQVQVTATLASYQGELSYDASALKLEGAELPQGIVGAWNEVKPGQVRFAGAAMTGVSAGPVLTLRFTSKGAVQANAFKLRMEEVVGAANFENLTKQVVEREQPLFSKTPLE